MFQVADGGRAKSKRPRQSNDCTVRAFALACAVPYDLAYDTLAAAGRRSGGRFKFREWVEGTEFAEYEFTWRGFPAVRGERRMNPHSFAEKHPSGRFILRTAGHVMACIDGVLLDTAAPPAGRCVYGAWRVEPVRGPD